MKTITISDETYKKLEVIKNGRSFSETIDNLIAKNVSTQIDNLLEIIPKRSTGREDELAKVVEGIRKRTRAKTLKK